MQTAATPRLNLIIRAGAPIGKKARRLTAPAPNLKKSEIHSKKKYKHKEKEMAVMIKAYSLMEFLPTACIENDTSTTIYTLYRRFSDYAKKTGLPVEFYKDEVVAGGFLKKQTEPCMVMNHPDKKLRYLKFCIRVKRLGTKTFVYFSSYGTSAQMLKASKAAENRKKGKFFRALIASFGQNRFEYENEQLYYECIRRMLTAK